MGNRDSPIVYICSPYSGDVEHNTLTARRYSRYATEQGCVALAPQLLLPQYISEETERDLALSAGLRLLDMCQELWVCGDRISEGMKREIEHAHATGNPVRYVKEGDTNVCD